MPHIQSLAQLSLPSAVKYKLLVRTANDGYLYLGSDFKLYFCDHSGDDRNGCPRGPEACEDKPSPINIESVANAPLTNDGAFVIKRQDGYSVLLSKEIWVKLANLIKVLRFA